MVKVKIFFKNRRPRVSNFPRASFRDARLGLKRINPKITRVARFRKRR